MRFRNNDADASTWTCKHSESFLKTYGSVQKGNKAESRDECLLKPLIANGLESLVSLSKTELRSACSELKSHDAADTSEDDIIKSVSGMFLNNYGDTTNGMISLIDEEMRDEDAV